MRDKPPPLPALKLARTVSFLLPTLTFITSLALATGLVRDAPAACAVPLELTATAGGAVYLPALIRATFSSSASCCTGTCGGGWTLLVRVRLCLAKKIYSLSLIFYIGWRQSRDCFHCSIKKLTEKVVLLSELAVAVAVAEEKEEREAEELALVVVFKPNSLLVLSSSAQQWSHKGATQRVS